MTKTRSTRLRDRLGQATRTIILEAFVAEVAEHGTFDLTYFALARRAGLSVRTLYRHFPTRGDLLDALSRHVTTAVGIHDRPRSRDEIVATVRRLFPTYDRHPALITAQLQVGLGGKLRSRSRSRQRRAGMVHDVLTASVPHLSPDRQLAAAGLLTCLLSASVWQRLRDEAGLDGTQAGDITGWAIETLWKALEIENDRARRRG